MYLINWLSLQKVCFKNEENWFNYLKRKIMDMNSEIIIQGLTSAGKPFRPSDWAERLSGVFSTFGADRRMCYSPYVRPVDINGVKCVSVNKALEAEDAMAYRFLISFAKDNDLQMIETNDQKAAKA